MSRMALGVTLASVIAVEVLVPLFSGELMAQEESGVKVGEVAPAVQGETLDEATEKAAVEADVPPPSAELSSVIVSFFADLNAETVKEKVDTFFDPTAVVEDPFGRYERRAEIADHWQRLFDGAKTIGFEVRSEFQSGEESVALWTLSIVHPKLRGGEEPVVIEGVTHARIVNGKIAEQRDYYDVGGLIYENLTVFGALVRWVKSNVLGD